MSTTENGQPGDGLYAFVIFCLYAVIGLILLGGLFLVVRFIKWAWTF